MKVTVNGKDMEIEDGMSISDFVVLCQVRPDVAIIELNEKVVSRVAWAETMLSENDKVELVTLVGGG